MPTPNLIHCSYHKCLTVYYKRVMDAIFNRCLPWSGGYRHFNSHLDDFHAAFAGLRVASVNNRSLDLERLGSFRISRFVRDPRDLVVSGYFYHRRGAEPWTTMVNPSAEDWYFANGNVPEGMRERMGEGDGISFAQYLQSLDEEEGLLAELEFRRFHLDSMADWPTEHADILTFRYEEILGNELGVFHRLFDFYGLSWLERKAGDFFAKKYSLRKMAADPHVRNPASGQWRKHFTPRVQRAFDDRHGALVETLGYPRD